MNQLIKVTVKNDQQLVSARELYKGLKVKTRFSQWVTQNFKLFIEENDFEGVVRTTPFNPLYPNGKQQEIQDYALTVDMAKQLSLMSQTPQGRIYREYFISIENKWNDPAEIVKRGYAILQNENTKLKIENAAMHPKALFADAVSVSSTSILVGDLAKLIKQNGVDIGANRMFKWLREKGYLINRKGTDWNMPTQRSMELKLFKVKETSIQHSDGHVSVNKTPKVTGKGQQYFINRFLNDERTA